MIFAANVTPIPVTRKKMETTGIRRKLAGESLVCVRESVGQGVLVTERTLACHCEGDACCPLF